MSSLDIVPYDPRQHANAAPRYSGPYVVDGQLPLSALEFPPEADELAEYVGPRNPLSCPKFDVLVAVPATPRIVGAEEKQHLTVPCASRENVRGLDGVTAYPVCRVKAERAGLDIANLPNEWLTDPPRRGKIRCPFVYLGGSAVAPGVRVDVAVDAKNPAAPDSYQAIS